MQIAAQDEVPRERPEFSFTEANYKKVKLEIF